MPLILPNSIFVRTPRCASTWSKDLFKNLGLLKGEVGQSHDTMDDIGGIQSVDKVAFKWCFVRDPLQWYVSYWAYKSQYGWGNKSGAMTDVLDELPNEDFDPWIEAIYTKYPKGFIKNVFGHYRRGCDFVGQYENLHEDMIKGLQMSGEVFNEEFIRRYGRRNASNKQMKRFKIADSVNRAIKRFEYD